MKFPDYDYFQRRAAEVKATIVSTEAMSDAQIQIGRASCRERV